jgi:gliding motility-associated-like protein
LLTYRTHTYFSLLLSLLFLSREASAQLCSGSLGDPIVNITFGAGANPGAPLNAATTAYRYFALDCPDDGFYTVRNNTSNCFGTSWYSMSVDHTGNPGGYFMLVNASLQPSAFYVDTVRGLCANTRFEFAAWVANVLRPSACNGGGIEPNLTFTIERTDGTVLRTYSTGLITQTIPLQWRQYGFFFTTPPGVSDVVLRIFNNSRGGCGNDLALDDITFRPCGPLLQAGVDGFANDTINYCEAAPRSFLLRSSLSAGFSNPAFLWQQSADGITWTDIPGASAEQYQFSVSAATPAGRYYFRTAGAEQENFASVQCRVVSPPVLIVKGLKPVTRMQISSPACEGGPVTFSASGGTAYLWTREGGGLGVSDNPFTLPSVEAYFSGKIYVQVTGEGGCVATDSAFLEVLPKPDASVLFREDTLCAGQSNRLSASGGFEYRWEPPAGLDRADIASPLASPDTTTTYIVTVTGNNSCSDRDTVTVTVIRPMEANAGPDQVILSGESIQLQASMMPDVSWQWSPSLYMDNPAVVRPVVSPPADQQYTLTVTTARGCHQDSDTVLVKVFRDIYIPGAFTPNGDGLNDTWNIPALAAFPSFTLQVYNRLGQQVYESRNRFQSWDGYFRGEPQAAGTYIYLLNLNREGRSLIKGTLVLVR